MANEKLAILQEMESWSALLDETKSADTTLTIYIDLKSPHAYLAIRPTLEVARDFQVSLNFLPYTLSYTAIGVSESVKQDMQRRPASPAADRKARMYYATAREYARLQKLPLKSPYRLLDSELAHRFFLFAKTQNLELQFAMHVYLEGWSSGWRNFVLEDDRALRGALESSGATLAGLDRFLSDESDAIINETTRVAEASGIVGVPHYVFFDEASARELGLFGREHLSLIRSKFFRAGLNRHGAVRADISHAWQPT